MSQHHCESCGMPIEAGPYCQYCVDEQGELQVFDERFARMVQFTRRHDPSLDQKTAEERTLAYMATMPAWKNHPKVKGR
jgi:hypothetical protein